jgi:hypothetical protein
VFTDDDIDLHLKHYIDAAKSFIEKRESVVPVCFLFCTVDPRDGTAEHNVCPLMMGDEHREHFSRVCQALAIAGEASHAIFVCDAYFTTEQRDIAEMKTPVRDMPSARDALCILVERRGRGPLTVRIPYVCDQGEVIWEPEVRAEATASSGRLQFLPRGHVTKDLVDASREVARLMLDGQAPGVQVVNGPDGRL